MATIKTFDTSTLKGLQSAERFKSRMENKYQTVTVRTIGLDRVSIVGRDTEHGHWPKTGIVRDADGHRN